MNLKTIGYVVLVVGVIIALAGLLAESLGLGCSEGFGNMEHITLLGGIAVAVVGAYLGFIRKEDAGQKTGLPHVKGKGE